MTNQIGGLRRGGGVPKRCEGGWGRGQKKTGKKNLVRGGKDEGDKGGILPGRGGGELGKVSINKGKERIACRQRKNKGVRE